MSVEKPLHVFSLQASVFEYRISRAVKRPADFFCHSDRLLCRSIRQEKNNTNPMEKNNTNPDFVSGFVQFACGGTR